jgi:Zn ribbon nucleic-acid-binding protein
MSVVKDFFRSCPACERRFQIKLVRKEPVEFKKEPGIVRRAIIGPTSGSVRLGATVPLTLVEGDPVIVDIEEFQYVYRCKACGHQWAEEHEEKHVGEEKDS